jgi:hypothetical protein
VFLVFLVFGVLVEINQLFVVQEFVGIGDVSRHGIGFALGAHSRFIVHPLEFVDYFRENAADIFDHLVHRLAGRLFEIFADVHGANSIAKTVKTKKRGHEFSQQETKTNKQRKEQKDKMGRNQIKMGVSSSSYILPFDFLALCQINTQRERYANIKKNKIKDKF